MDRNMSEVQSFKCKTLCILSDIILLFILYTEIGHYNGSLNTCVVTIYIYIYMHVCVCFFFLSFFQLDR